MDASRNRGVDLAKTIAILGVIIVHLSANTVAYGALRTPAWTAALFWRCLFGACVPIFFMCSGALFLDKEKSFSIKKLYGKNLVRLVCAMVFWAMAYKLWDLLLVHQLSFDGLCRAFLQVLCFEQQPHLYFIHIMFLVYALLPVLRVFTEKATARELEYALVVWFVLGILAADLKPLLALKGIPAQWPLNMAWSSLGYVLLGHYLGQYGLKVKVALLAAIAGFCIMFFGTAYFSVAAGTYKDTFLSGMGTGACLLGTGVFSLSCKLAGKMGDKLSHLCAGVSKASFCTYTSHMFIIYIYISQARTLLRRSLCRWPQPRYWRFAFLCIK